MEFCQRFIDEIIGSKKQPSDDLLIESVFLEEVARHKEILPVTVIFDWVECAHVISFYHRKGGWFVDLG